MASLVFKGFSQLGLALADCIQVLTPKLKSDPQLEFAQFLGR